jgi:hypothetical protein
MAETRQRLGSRQPDPKGRARPLLVIGIPQRTAQNVEQVRAVVGLGELVNRCGHVRVEALTRVRGLAQP